MASIFLDETTASFKLGSDTIANPSLQSNAFIGGTTLPLEGGTVSLAFQGTSAAFYGEIGSANFSTTVAELTNLVIDGGAPSSTTIQEQGTDNLFYQTPNLTSGSHNVSFFTFSNLDFDFFVISAANDTDLSGQTLIVDDSDASVVYSGDWTKNSSVLQASTNSRTPYGGSTHQTNAAGASATFSFAGSSVSVYGVINTSPISITFIMDGVPVPATQFPDSNGNLNPTFLWFSSDSLTPGDHTLQMKVAQISGAFFTLDYILYKPSFSTLASKPAVSQTSPSPSGKSNGASTPTNSASTGQAAPNSGPNASGNAVSGSKSSTAVIVGSVVGSLALVIIIGLIFWLLWRKRMIRRRRHASIDLSNESDAIPDPFPPPLYTENRTNASSDLFMQIGKPANRVMDINSRGLTDEGSGLPPTTQSSLSLLRIDPFYLPAEPRHGETFSTSLPQRKLALSHQEVSQTQQSQPSHFNGNFAEGGDGGMVAEVAAENPRVQELVTELQRELAGSSSEGRDALLRGILVQGNATGGRNGGGGQQDTRWASRQSAAPSTLPPPYEPDVDAPLERPPRSGKVS